MARVKSSRKKTISIHEVWAFRLNLCQTLKGVVPTGLTSFRAHPALKRWAIIRHPFGVVHLSGLTNSLLTLGQTRHYMNDLTARVNLNFHHDTWSRVRGQSV